MKTMNKKKKEFVAMTDDKLSEQRTELSKFSEAQRKTDALLADAGAYQSRKLAEKKAARLAKKN